MNYEIQYPKEYTEEIRKLETTDRGHAETTFNPVFKKLVNNDAYLKEQQDTIRQDLDTHTDNGDIHVTAAQKTAWTKKAETTLVTAAAAGLMAAADKAKLDGIQNGAEVNQNALQTVRAGGVNVQANNKAAQIELVAGNNVSITGDNATKKITITGASAVKNPASIAIQINGVTVASYDGSTAKTINITLAGIGAASANHTHAYLPLTGGTVDGDILLNGSHQCAVRHIDGSTTGGMNGELFLNYSRESSIRLGTNGGGVISPDGRQYSGNSATATNADTVDGLHAADIPRMGGKHLAGQGAGGGYSFINDGAYDTGMFSDADGDLYFMRNGLKITLPISGTILNSDGKIASAGYADNAGSVAWNDVSGKPGTFTPTSHTHDERYYTEAEVNNLLNTKVNSDNPVFTGSFSMKREAGTAIGEYSVTLGNRNTASNTYSMAGGFYNVASGDRACVMGGGYNTASGVCSFAANRYSIANGSGQTVVGAYNKPDDSLNTVYNLFKVGNGFSADNRSNAFRLTSSGDAYVKTAYHTGGADYAEFFEWLDKNPKAEDRVGFFVTLDGNKVKIASAGDYILGVVSGAPSVVGNSPEDWTGRWKKDDFGRVLIEKSKTPILDKDGNETGEYTELEHPIAVETYDSTKPYIERDKRPEWSADGMLGVLTVWDDGTCQINGYCQVANGGIATAASGGEFALVDGQIVKRYRVIERVTDKIVKIIFR